MKWLGFDFINQCFELLLSYWKMLNRFRCYLFASVLIAFDISAICTVTLILETFRPSQIFCVKGWLWSRVLHYKFNAHEPRITIIAIVMPYTSSFIRLFTVGLRIGEVGEVGIGNEFYMSWCDAMQCKRIECYWKTKWYYYLMKYAIHSACIERCTN